MKHIFKRDHKKNIQKTKEILIILVTISAVFAVAAFCPGIISYYDYDVNFPSYDFPIDYTNLDTVDSEEKVLFEGFRTSFIPDDEIMLCQFQSKSKREVSDDNNASDIMFLWDLSEEEATVSTRLKRESNTTSKKVVHIRSDDDYNEQKQEDQDYDEPESQQNNSKNEDYGRTMYPAPTTFQYRDYDEPEIQQNHKEKEDLDSMTYPAPTKFQYRDYDEPEIQQNHEEKEDPDSNNEYTYNEYNQQVQYNQPEEYQEYHETENQQNYNDKDNPKRDPSDEEFTDTPILKRKSNSTSNYYAHIGSDDKTYIDYDEQEEDQDNEESESQLNYNEKEDLESMVRPQTHVDRGPLDDVVEQSRDQPELEEGEMASSAHLYKPAKPHSGIHALYKGQGDKNTIRATQANIMRRNMDAEADPCQDFYQYACGNWAALNPIPADKAGYDTFEMLRENLDSILKDLLEIIKDEQITSEYPGPHLEINDNLLKDIKYQNTNDEELHPATLEKQTREVLKSANVGKYRYYLKKSEQEKSEIINRIRHILYRKPRAALKLLNDNSQRFNFKKRKPYQRRRRRLKQRDSVNKSFKYDPGRKLSLKKSKKTTDIVFRRRKIQAINAKSNKDLKREAKYTKRETPSNKCGDPACGDAAMKARFLFKSCMNYGILQKRGHQPLLDLLNLLGGWPILDPTWNKKDFDWLELMAKLRLYNNDILISEWVGPDIKNSDEFVIQFDQTSLGLPTREYFLQDSNKVYLDAYKNYLIKVALLLGGDKRYVEESAEKLIDFEIKLAKITSAPEDRRNVSELYRRMTLANLEIMVPQVNWRRYLCVVMNRTVRSNETVVLFALNYVRHLVTLINDTDPSILSNYLLWRFVRHRVNNLDDRFQSAKQQFYFILFGREQAPPRWKNCISQVNSNMGMALGSMFVKKYFDETSKNDTLTMTREIQQSFRELLHKITWIDDETKKLAAHKVDAMMLRIGYPDFILSKNQLNERYKEVKIHPDKYFENILNILQHLTQMEQSRIGQPVNKTLWNTAPAVVNAYYSRNKNQIMFPAGILQPPFYHRHFPRSLNYGGIGVVIGHEITHGFDDKGRLFDCNGNLHRWWSDTAIESFHRRAQCLIDQYGEYVVPEVSMKLDGVNTQGENIADNGGVKQAFRAYKHWVQHHGTEGETLPGLNHTHTQLFFLNFAQVWCGAMRPEAMRNKLKTAVHSPGRFRVIGTLSNSLDFAREFQCPPGTPMNPVHKCTVW